MQRAERKKDVFLDVFTSMMTEQMQKNQRRRTAIVPILQILLIAYSNTRHW
jgi:hypothetical protein